MKKIVITSLLLGSALLTGCSQDTKTVTNLEYITTVEAAEDTLIQFRSEEGNLYNFYTEDYYELEKDTKYDVEVTVETWAIYGDYIERVTKSK